MEAIILVMTTMSYVFSPVVHLLVSFGRIKLNVTNHNEDWYHTLDSFAVIPAHRSSTDNHFIRLFKAAHQMYIATWIKSIQPFMYYYAIWIRVYTAIVTMPIIVVAVYVIFCCSSILQRKRDIQYIIIIRHRSLNKESTIPSSSILMTYQVKLVTVWCKVKHISWLARLSLLLLLMVSSFCTFVLACRHMLPGHFCRSLNRRCPARVHCSKHGHKYPRQEWHKGLAISLLSFQDHT